MKLSWATYVINSSLHITGSERRRNSYVAFSMVSNSVCDNFNAGGLSEDAGIRVTAMMLSE